MTIEKIERNLKIGKIIITILFILFFTYLIIGSFVAHESRTMCRNECSDKGTRFSQVIPNGETFNTHDLCICYLENKVESFIQ